MKLTRNEIETLWNNWNTAWDNHDLNSVMEFFHDDIYFNNWTGGSAKGKEQLRDAWQDWFLNHGNFEFVQEENFIDVDNQKLLYRWELNWPSFEKGYEGRLERRRGVDVIHFTDGKIIKKLTYSKTTLEIEGEHVKLTPSL
ncbi:MAG: nuclear transport factor 2 family protein [Desulfobacteraceae bacterium]|nr:nuclear transport factor 2 family protein [Desulfobacteraceae bacterium]